MPISLLGLVTLLVGQKPHLVFPLQARTQLALVSWLGSADPDNQIVVPELHLA